MKWLRKVYTRHVLRKRISEKIKIFLYVDNFRKALYYMEMLSRFPRMV